MLTKALKARQTRLQDEKGFTLIELLAVIVILGIIAVIAIPMIGNILDKSKKDGDVATARQVYDAARMYVIGGGGSLKGEFKSATVTLGELKSEGYIEKTIVMPSIKEELDETKTKVVFSATGDLESVMLSPATESKAKEFKAKEVLGVAPATNSGSDTSGK
ncbi:type II secretion system protein [Paenibacillus sp. EC2-1]|uniref:type II secretion system protein n=1 Tax=Paenibacillus sp. EC2-1 TaxID=3388665 RepID=UPI003BEEDB13